MSNADDSTADEATRQTRSRRKLKRPRTTNACDFCRRRKSRCSGDMPTCTLCAEHGVHCDYNAAPPARRRKSNPSNELQSVEPEGGPLENHQRPYTAPIRSLNQSRRTSLEPPDLTFDLGQHVGPTSGVSFLYQWQDGGAEGPSTGEEVPLASYGDVSLPRVHHAEIPTLEEGRKLL